MTQAASSATDPTSPRLAPGASIAGEMIPPASGPLVTSGLLPSTWASLQPASTPMTSANPARTTTRGSRPRRTLDLHIVLVRAAPLMLSTFRSDAQLDRFVAGRQQVVDAERDQVGGAADAEQDRVAGGDV